MMLNSFGKNFMISIWGESYGVGVGVVIDGCLLYLLIMVEEI